MEKWKTIKSEPLVDSRWVKVRKDSVDLPNGQHIDDFYAISLNDAAAIVALDDAGNIVLKKEYRYCLDRDLIEIPAGGFERGEDMVWQLPNESFWKKLDMLRTTGSISEQR